MTVSFLEDFGHRRPDPVRANNVPEMPAEDRYDDGYNAGWEDALAQVEASNARIGERLGERLEQLDQTRDAAIRSTMSALEPALRDVFDKVLPHAAERAFLSVLLEEMNSTLRQNVAKISIAVAPEDLAPMQRLLESSSLDPDRVTVEAESALSVSQALLRWTGEERRLDLEGTLNALDSALEAFLTRQMQAESEDIPAQQIAHKEAKHG